MTNGPPNLNQRSSTLAGLAHGAQLVWRLLQDPRVPGWIKLVPLFTLIYLISPIDLVPDFLVGPGRSWTTWGSCCWGCGSFCGWSPGRSAPVCAGNEPG